MQRVLVAVDGSDGADRALNAAAELAKANAAELIIVNVEQGYLSENAEAIGQADGANLDAILFSASEETLARAHTKATALGVTKISTHSGLGDAAGFILEVAKNERPDI